MTMKIVNERRWTEFTQLMVDEDIRDISKAMDTAIFLMLMDIVTDVTWEHTMKHLRAIKGMC